MGQKPIFHNTADILETYINDILKGNDLDSKLCSKKLEFTFGKKIHQMIDGFIRFAEQNDVELHDIKATLVHDLSGGLNHDKMMLPRVSEYGKYSLNEHWS